MNLADTLQKYFSPDVRELGYDIYRAGNRITYFNAGPNFVEAIVEDSQNYDVEIEWFGGDLELSCSCPYSEENGECKHLWAVIIAANTSRIITEQRLRHRIRVRFPVFEDADFDEDIGFDFDLAPLSTPPPKAPPKAPPKPPDWRVKLATLEQRMRVAAREPWPEGREIQYVIDAANSHARQRLQLHLWMRDRRKGRDGWNQFKEFKCSRGAVSQIPNPVDREIVSMLPPTMSMYSPYYSSYFEPSIGHSCELVDPLSVRIVELACATGRCHLKSTSAVHIGDQTDTPPLEWEGGEPWRFRIRVEAAGPKTARAAGELFRGGERMDLKTPELMLPGGLIFTKGKVARLDDGGHFEWISGMRETAALQVPRAEAAELAAALVVRPAAPAVDVSEEIPFERLHLPMTPRFIIRPPEPHEMDTKNLRGEALFSYGEWAFLALHPDLGYFDREQNRMVMRDRAAEGAAWETLRGTSLPAPLKDCGDHCVYKVLRSKLPSIVRTLVEAGWHVETDGKAFRTPVSSSFAVTSHIDWFELDGDFDFGGASVKLPELLRALHKGELMVPLSDGTYGLVSQEWIDKLTPFAHFGEAGDGAVRFRRSQAGLLDALLATEPQATFDEEFAKARDALKSFGGVRALPQPDTFNGQLRDYQKDGLGWMEFLRRFGFGGCLADDMGVGKTAQVLAMLEARRAEGAASGAALVVVPRSLIFNWKQEAERFTPHLRVLDHSGVDRAANVFAGYDVVLTTYGILRRDIVALRQTEFDYVVLDEAQAIKNAASESAKAARLLKARHRLALSGTPVENHLGELASLVEFLNPGMLGPGGPVQLSAGLLRNPAEETRTVLARALRPFILRRTKRQVARELPEKTEQIIICELKQKQRKLYDEMRDFYRASLLKRVAADGLAKSKMHVLEALLRLRQAACHPGLIDPKHAGDPSAKVETLLAQIGQVVEEGHKALVFSQFTSLLALVRPLLDKENIRYEYLDGSTTDRQAHVERFQNDADCPLFLISLKAGGLGLNLTAAEYVYLLDPWWNPAVEAQAIDRTHRIGQTRNVFAYRLIAKDTVEEKVLQLQQTKRDLVNAIIGEDNSLIRDLRREDLEMLFG